MLNTTLLASPLAGAGAKEGPQLEAGDPRLEEISALALAGEYLPAALKAELLFKEEIYDARLLGFYLYGVFAQEGAAGLPIVLRSTLLSLTDNFSALSPARKRQPFADSALTWLFQTLGKQLEYQQQKQDEAFARLADPAQRPALAAALELCPQVEAAMSSALKKPKTVPPFQRFAGWLGELWKTLAPPPGPAASLDEAEAGELDAIDPPEEVAGVRPATVDRPAPRAAIGAAASGAAASIPGPGGAAIVVEGSPALHQLLRKLQAFESLIKREEFQKAAVMVGDLQAIMEHFDPKIYFPRLFTGYCSLLAQHMEALEPCLENLEGRQGRALAQLYQIDLDTFVGGAR